LLAIPPSTKTTTTTTSSSGLEHARDGKRLQRSFVRSRARLKKLKVTGARKASLDLLLSAGGTSSSMSPMIKPLAMFSSIPTPSSSSSLPRRTHPPPTQRLVLVRNFAKIRFFLKWEYLLFSSNFPNFGKEKLEKKLRRIWTLILVW